MTGLPEVTRQRFLVETVIATLAFSVAHYVALLSLPEEVARFDFRGGRVPTEHISGWGNWQITPEGLTATPETGGFALGFSKSSFQEIFIDVKPTPQGRGRVRVQVIHGAVVDNPPEYLPEKPEQDPPWQLGLGRASEEIEATSLVPPEGPVNLGPLWPGGGSRFLIVMPVEKATGPLVESITVRTSVWVWSGLLVPALWLVVSATSLYVSAVTGKLAGKISNGVALLVMAAAIVLPLDALEWTGPIAVAAATAIAFAYVQRRNVSCAECLVLFTLIFLAVALRVQALNEGRFKPLDPDAGAFREIAESMSWFYDTREREPLFILLVKTSLAVFGRNDMAVRMVSFFGSVLLVPALWWVGREIQGPATGFVAAALIAASENWAEQSVRGLRLEWFTLALLALTAAVVTRRPATRLRHAAWLGGAAAAVCLIRLTSLWFCLAAIAYGVYRRGWNSRAALLGGAIAVVPLLPFVIRCGVEFGDPLYAVNKHIKFYRNHEFKGQPGFPTVAEVERDAYTGPEATSFEYFFGQHSVGELARRTVRGFEDIFFGGKLRELTCDGHRLLQWWAILAYGVVALSPQRWLLAWMLMLIGPIVWLYSPTSEPEWRLIFHASAFVYLTMGLAVGRVRDGGDVKVAQGSGGC